MMNSRLILNSKENELDNFSTRVHNSDLFITESKCKIKTMFKELNSPCITKGNLVLVDSRGNGYQLGGGGLHNIAPVGVWRESETHSIVNVDAKSYYPSNIVAARMSPTLVPTMWETLEEEMLKRFAVKDKLKSESLSDSQRAELKCEDSGVKLILNSSFGKTFEKFSLLYEPKVHFSTTITGQWMLLKLIDMIHDEIEDCQLINANTDGVCFYMNKNEEETMLKIMNKWEKIFK